jgi:hypothetical protein
VTDIPAPLFLTAGQAATYLAITEYDLWRMRRSGGGPPFSMFGVRPRYRRDLLEKWGRERDTYTSIADRNARDLTRRPGARRQSCRLRDRPRRDQASRQKAGGRVGSRAMTVPTRLYRHFDADNVLLYVGISLSAVQRLQRHSKRRWADQIARVEIVTFPTRAAALAAEAEAIVTERPLFNKAGRQVVARVGDAEPLATGNHLARWLAIGETCLRISKQVNAEMGNPNAPVTGKRGGAVNIAFNAALAAYPELVDLDCDLRTAAMKCAEHRHVTAEVLKTFSAYQLSGGIGIEGLWRRVVERIAAGPGR